MLFHHIFLVVGLRVKRFLGSFFKRTPPLVSTIAKAHGLNALAD
jgi:hypothetical protein